MRAHCSLTEHGGRQGVTEVHKPLEQAYAEDDGDSVANNCTPGQVRRIQTSTHVPTGAPGARTVTHEV